MSAKDRRALGIVLGAALLLKLVVLVTYPLNVSGDGFTYFRMLVTRTSNLAHAGGYPFLIGLPLAVPRAILASTRGPESALLTPTEGTPAGQGAAAPPTEDGELKARWLPVVAFYVHLANHLLDAVALVVLFLLLKAIFGLAVAVVGALVYGLDPWNVQWATLSRPELAQSNLLVLMLGALYWARRASDPRRKLAGYAAGAALFTLCALVKFNAVLLLPLPLVLLAVDPAPLRTRVRLAGLSLGVALAVYASYVVFYHAPTTGTWDLAYTTGHNLHERLRRNPPPLGSPDNGIASRKLAVLVRVLPAEPASCCAATLFSRVDWVPEAERRPYRERYLALLQTTDAARVAEAWAAVAERPPGKVTAIHYYLGAPEADRLLRATFFEAVRARPGAFLAGSGRLFLQAFVQPPEPLVPVLAAGLDPDPSLLVVADPAKREPLAAGFVRLKSGEYRSRALDYKGDPVLWLPGVAFLSGALVVTRVPALVLWGVAAAGAWLALRRWPGGAPPDPVAARWGPALTLAVLLLFIAVWSLFFGVRNKDLRLVLPLLDALVAVGACRVVGAFRRSEREPSRAWS